MEGTHARGSVRDPGAGRTARTLVGSARLRRGMAECLDGEVVVVRCATEALRTVIADAVRLPRFIVPSVTMLNRGGWGGGWRRPSPSCTTVLPRRR